MTVTDAFVDDTVVQARVEHYAMFSALLAEPPSAELMEAAKRLAAHYGGSGDETTRLVTAWRQFAQALETQPPAVWAEEYERLFYGVSRPEVIPYGSFYLTGFMMEEPLAELRSWWAEKGLHRRAEISEPEDHIAAVLEVMTHLIVLRDETAQRDFFVRFVWSWAGRFATALAEAPNAGGYRALAELLDAFLTLEAFYWEVEV